MESPLKINPFEPFAPVNPGSFVGRLSDLRRLKAALLQTANGRPANFMITGERGIGKTSLLNYLTFAARGLIPIQESKLSFVVVDADIEQDTTQLGLMSRIELGLKNSLGRHEPGREFLAEAWGFLKRVEAGGLKVGEVKMASDEVLLDEFSYSLAETASRICGNDAPALFKKQCDGILVLIDEADNSSEQLQLGAFLKLLTERLQRRGCGRVMFGLAGLPSELRRVLQESHPSSLRIFEEVLLDRLPTTEINAVIDLCLEAANEENPAPTSITDDGRQMLVAYSEGYPHFIQQFGYSAFAADIDGVIDEEDVRKGSWGSRGAFEQIGERYYRDNFYKRIQKESYRRVLRIMAANLDFWVTKKHIRAHFEGSDTVLDSALQALRSRNIILSKEGERGVYRLQHKGFAVWIRHYTQDPESELQI